MVEKENEEREPTGRPPAVAVHQPSRPQPDFWRDEVPRVRARFEPHPGVRVRDRPGTAAGKSLTSHAIVGAKSSNPMKKFRLAVGSDHAGFASKQPIIDFLRQLGHTVEDCGSFDATPIDFPDITCAVCARVQDGRAERAILVCGSGVGACIVANKLPGIRASLIHDIYCAHQCVEHDDVNVACIGALVVGRKVIEDCLVAFLDARFSEDPDVRRRVDKLNALDRRAGE